MSRYTSTTPEDLSAMLAAIGVGSIAEIFDRQIPEPVRLRRALALPAGMPEQDVYAHLRALAQRNVSAEDELTFLGAGMYDHYVPAIIDMLMGRSEFLTPYTPYQPEISQGGLQVMFEYQTAISELTGLPVSNASVYEGPSAVAAAGYMAKLHNGKGKFVVSAGVHPHTLETLRTYAHGYGVQVVEVGLRDGVTDPEEWAGAIDDDTSAAIFAQPNFYGAVEDASALAAAAKAGAESARAVVIAQVDPLTLGVLAPPGECGVDVAVGEGQSLGNRLDFGGPSFGFFAAREEYLRRMPGRIAGETRDVDGRRGFVLTLQTREQHIRREKATSNICTAQALNALGGVVYLAWLGRHGLVELGELLLARTHYARETLASIDGVERMHSQPAVREFALRLDADVAAVRRECAARGVNPGADLHALTGREQDRGGLLVALTEQRSRGDIDRLAQTLAAAIAAQRGGAVERGGAAEGGGAAGGGGVAASGGAAECGEASAADPAATGSERGADKAATGSERGADKAVAV
ncbi:MAG TPA: aminomethyl-transferring glycine dehydrogenase subunit GcvPA [Solirubrobacteraceae bacterium]|nr:aminomethyl-transferring glycine dehydrogenase subunit GcvPA [Solirubrobacteraceae bacterium]